MEWMIWCPDDGDEFGDGRKVTADTPREAVELWAGRRDYESAEYWLAKGNTLEVIIAPAVSTDNSRELRYMVSGEAAPSYYAQLVVTPKC